MLDGKLVICLANSEKINLGFGFERKMEKTTVNDGSVKRNEFNKKAMEQARWG